MENVLLIVVVALLITAVVRAGKQPLWAEAYRRLRRNPVAVVSLVVIGLYGTVALLDSVGWKDQRAGARRTVIDRLFQRPKERTYSAPLATKTTGEPTPHPLRGKHLLGT